MAWKIFGLVLAAIAVVAALRYRAARAVGSSRDRRIRRMAYDYAWRLVYGRRSRRLTDQRGRGEGER